MYFSYLSRSTCISSSANAANSVKTLAFFLIKNNNFSSTATTSRRKVDDDDFNGNQPIPNPHPHNGPIEEEKQYEKGGNFSGDAGYVGAGTSRRSYHHHSASTFLEKTPPSPSILWWNIKKPESSSKVKVGSLDSGTDGEQEEFKNPSSSSIYPDQLLQNPTTLANSNMGAETNTSPHQQYMYHKYTKELDDIWNNYKVDVRNRVDKAMQVLVTMEIMGVHLDLPRTLRLMQDCGVLGELKYAKKLHRHLVFISSTKTTTTTTPIQQEVSTYNQILDMYSECGSMSDAWEVFVSMPQRNLMSWDTMIAGFAKNGPGDDALDLFYQFKEAGLKPNGQMFMGVFLACSVLCDIDAGMLHFESMSKVYGIVPSMEHYVSVVNMLGSIGYLDEAVEFIEKMPLTLGVDVWVALMNLCWAHGNNKLGDHCAKMIKYLDPSRVTDELVKTFAKDRKKHPGLIEYSIMNGGNTDCHQKELIDCSRKMISQMKEFGYAFRSPYVWTPDILLPKEEEKEESLFYHLEKCGVALNLMYT